MQEHYGGDFLLGESALTGQFERTHLSAITSVTRLVRIYGRHTANRSEIDPDTLCVSATNAKETMLKNELSC